MENHSQFYGCANNCNKFASSWSWKTIKFPLILLLKGTSPCYPYFKRPGGNAPSFHRSPASLKLPMMLLCKGTCAPIAPLSKGRGEVLPSCTSVPAFLVICSVLKYWDQRKWKTLIRGIKSGVAKPALSMSRISKNPSYKETQ